MSGDDIARTTAIVLMIVLVGSSLAARRIPMGQFAKMAAAWIGIFLIVFIGFTYRGEIMGVGQRLRAEIDPAAAITAPDGSLRIRKAEDGHFWVRGQVNGKDVDFLIDSGATTIALSPDVVKAAGIAPSDRRGEVDTAAGPVTIEVVRIDRLVVGPFERERIEAMTAPEFRQTNVLGMNWLSGFASWGVEGDWLILRG